MNITKYPIVHENTVICEVDVPCTEDGKTTNETRLVIDAALQVRTAMLRWHNKEMRELQTATRNQLCQAVVAALPQQGVVLSSSPYTV